MFVIIFSKPRLALFLICSEIFSKNEPRVLMKLFLLKKSTVLRAFHEFQNVKNDEQALEL